jgi:AraC-like DNA-binding protein
MFFPAHRHDFYELVFFTKGNGTHSIDFSNYKVEPNLIYFLSPGQIHEMKSQECQGYVIALSKELFNHIQTAENISFSQLFHHPQNKCSINISTKHISTFHNLIKLLENETAKTIQNQNLIRNYMSALLISCLECSHLSKFNKINDRITRLRIEINESFITERSGTYYAQKICISLKHLNDLSKEALGKTVSQLIHERIILEAKREISYTDKSIKELAYKLGFKDPGYFNRFFKRFTEMTPDEFRKISK